MSGRERQCSARSAEEAASCSVSEARSLKRKKHAGVQGELAPLGKLGLHKVSELAIQIGDC